MNSFFKNISVQFLGSALAQIIPFLFIPLLSTLFDPVEFSYLTKFQAISAILAVFVGFRYYNAIVLPSKINISIHLFYISIFSTILFSIFVGFFFLFVNNFTNYFNDIKFSYVIFPLFVLLYGINISFIQFSVRNKKFKTNSFSKVILSLINNTSSSVLGFFNNSFGLVYGRLIGLLFSVIYLYKRVKIKNLRYLKKNKIIDTAHIFKDFPKYTIYPALLDTLSIQALVLAIDFYFDENILGQFGFMIMFLGAPLSIISISFRDVVYQRMSDQYNDQSLKNVHKTFITSLMFLSLIAIFILVSFFLIGENIFYLIIDSKWSLAFSFAEILIFSYLLRMIVSPLSTVFNVFNKLKILSIWQIMAFISTLLTIFLSLEIFKLDILDFLLIYLIVDILLYVFYLILQLYITKILN